MLIVELLIALVFAVLLTLVLSAGFGRKGPWASVVTSFLVVFLATWTMGIWFVPFGPVLFGVSWLPFLIGGLIVALVMASAVPPQALPGANSAKEQPGQEKPVERQKRFDVFFVVVMVALVAALVVGYLVRELA